MLSFFQCIIDFSVVLIAKSGISLGIDFFSLIKIDAISSHIIIIVNAMQKLKFISHVCPLQKLQIFENLSSVFRQLYEAPSFALYFHEITFNKSVVLW